MSKCIKMKKNREKSRFIKEKPRINTKEIYVFRSKCKKMYKKMQDIKCVYSKNADLFFVTDEENKG